MDLVVQGTRAVCDQVVLVVGERDVDAIAPFGEKIDDRRAVQVEVVLGHQLFERRRGLLKQDGNAELALANGLQGLLKPVDGEEAKPIRTREVFVKKPVPAERAVVVRKDGFVLGITITRDVR